jgi:hypothetical protein
MQCHSPSVSIPYCPLNFDNLVYLFAVYVQVPYVTANLRTPPKGSQAVTAQSTINPAGSYVVPSTIGIYGLTLTPSRTRLLKETQ